MESQQLTPFGKYLTNRLTELGRTKEWLIRKLHESGNSLTLEQLDLLLIGEIRSKPREAAIGIIIHAEAERQRLKKLARI